MIRPGLTGYERTAMNAHMPVRESGINEGFCPCPSGCYDRVQSLYLLWQLFHGAPSMPFPAVTDTNPQYRT
nr:hypothetical protein [uncultured Methanoregula sp.]